MDQNTPFTPPPNPPQPPLQPPVAQSAPPQQQPQEAVVVESVQPQVAAALQGGKNVLVTVGTNPSVDELAAALGLTMLLGQLGKHATAVFSGKIPPAIEFLDPEKTFEDTVDSLRDFIIALDREKADKLRYKVEDDVVKVFITPYRTVINENDLEFSQGDFNVDVVIALGVTKRDELDKAITAHGRILHNATFITVNAGEATSSIGSLNWTAPEASSIAEMIVRLSDGLGEDILDAQTSTALLTGIVAETNRFSNDKTTPKVMNLSAQLMAAGANQQLIASNLRQEGMISESVRLQNKSDITDDGEMVLTHKSEKSKSGKKKRSKQNNRQEPTQGGQHKKAQPESNQLPVEPKEQKSEKVTEEKAESTDSPSERLEETLQRAAPSSDASQEKASETTPRSSEQQLTPHPTPLATPNLDTNPSATPTTPEVTPATPAITTPPRTRSATEKPQLGGSLNSFANGSEDSQLQQEPPRENFTLTHTTENETQDDAAKAAAVEEARKAVEQAAVEPAHQRLESINAMPLSPEQPSSTPPTPIEEPATVSTPSFSLSPPPAAQPPAAPVAPVSAPTNFPPVPPVAFSPEPVTPPLPQPLAFPPTMDSSLPPMPPMPSINDTQTAFPPMPPMPGPTTPSQPATPTEATQPQVAPSFLQDLQASQNQWTQAGQDIAQKQASIDAARQDKINERLEDYDRAVDANRSLQELPPVNNPPSGQNQNPFTQR